MHVAFYGTPRSEHLWFKRKEFQIYSVQTIYVNTGGPSSSCDMIILHNNSHGGIIRVCMRIFTTALRNKTIPLLTAIENVNFKDFVQRAATATM